MSRDLNLSFIFIFSIASFFLNYFIYFTTFREYFEYESLYNYVAYGSLIGTLGYFVGYAIFLFWFDYTSEATYMVFVLSNFLLSSIIFIITTLFLNGTIMNNKRYYIYYSFVIVAAMLVFLLISFINYLLFINIPLKETVLEQLNGENTAVTNFIINDEAYLVSNTLNGDHESKQVFYDEENNKFVMLNKDFLANGSYVFKYTYNGVEKSYNAVLQNKSSENIVRYSDSEIEFYNYDIYIAGQLPS